jgi:hypothetical protein
MLPDFLLIPYPLLVDEHLRPTDRLLYGVIYWYQHMKAEKCIASNTTNTTLAKILKVEPHTVQSGLERLEERRYILRLYADEERKIRTEIKGLIHFKKVPPNEGTVPSNEGTYPQMRVRGYPQMNTRIIRVLRIKAYLYLLRQVGGRIFKSLLISSNISTPPTSAFPRTPPSARLSPDSLSSSAARSLNRLSAPSPRPTPNAMPRPLPRLMS